MADAPILPDETENAWIVFCKIKEVSYTEIKSYMEITGDFLAWWEIDLIIKFDKIRVGEPKWQKQQS